MDEDEAQHFRPMIVVAMVDYHEPILIVKTTLLVITTIRVSHWIRMKQRDHFVTTMTKIILVTDRLLIPPIIDDFHISRLCVFLVSIDE